MCSLPSRGHPQSTGLGDAGKLGGTGPAAFGSQPQGPGSFRGPLPRSGPARAENWGAAERAGCPRGRGCLCFSHSAEAELTHPDSHPLQACNSTVVSKSAKWHSRPHSLILEHFLDGKEASSLRMCVVCFHCCRCMSPRRRIAPPVGGAPPRPRPELGYSAGTRSCLRSHVGGSRDLLPHPALEAGVGASDAPAVVGQMAAPKRCVCVPMPSSCECDRIWEMGLERRSSRVICISPKSKGKCVNKGRPTE